MTKMELAMATVNWKIEDAQKEYDQAKENIKRDINSESTCISEFILQYAERMHKTEMKLRDLYEQKNMLEYIAEEN
ncbi:MAG: hypothetical protein LUD12_13985 [Lachnospiraceae bacterium]|nr:hypothetical protein [Lachnospiraceae bacterium]